MNMCIRNLVNFYGMNGRVGFFNWGQGVGLQGPRGSRGHLWDPFVPSGWFDETSDDS